MQRRRELGRTLAFQVLLPRASSRPEKRNWLILESAAPRPASDLNPGHVHDLPGQFFLNPAGVGIPGGWRVQVGVELAQDQHGLELVLERRDEERIGPLHAPRLYGIPCGAGTAREGA
jgi:hypothetical protein